MLTVEDTRSGTKHPLAFTASWKPMWETNPQNVLVFEAYEPKLLGAEDKDLRASGWQLSTAHGWVLGYRERPHLPQARFTDIEDLMGRAFPRYAAHWTPPLRLPDTPLVQTVPDGLPGAGMIIVRNLSELVSGPASGGDLVEQQRRTREHVRHTLLSLGFTEVHSDDQHGGHPPGD